MKVVVEMRERDYNTMKKGFLIVGVHDGKPLDEVLDEIRAEIEQEYTIFRNKSDMWNERACGLGTALEIIDKHRKGGSE